MPEQNRPETPQQQPNRQTPGSKAGKAAKPSSIGTIGTIGGGQYVGEEHSFGFDSEGLHIPTGNSEVLLTRRQLLYGALGVAAAAGIGVASASLIGSDEGDGTVSSLQVGEDQVFTLDDCAETPLEDALVQIGEYRLPYGSLMWAGNDTVAACLLPTDTAKPLVRAALLNLTSGNEATVLEQADGQDDGFEIYDMRASDEGAIWAEANILTGEWRLYVSTISMLTFSDHHQVDSGDSSTEMPTLAAIGDTAFWQVMPTVPSEDDEDADEGETQIRCVTFSNPADVRTVFTAPGRFATAISPANAEGGVVVTPSDPESRNHRRMLLIDRNGEVKDQVVFPSRMTPMEACYGDTGFAFSFDSIYNYGEGISNLGTYTPEQKPETAAYSNRTWFRFTRTPSIPPSWCGEWFMVKSTSAVVGVHLRDRRYVLLPTDNNAELYGTCLASLGSNGTVVTYENIDRTEAVQDNEEVTENDRLCLVRVWTTPDYSAPEDEYYEEEEYVDDEGYYEE